jgi:hypothetical protein
LVLPSESGFVSIGKNHFFFHLLAFLWIWHLCISNAAYYVSIDEYLLVN